MQLFPKKTFEDWTVFKYGWFLVFIIHIAFLGMGIHWLMEGYNMDVPEMYTPSNVRISYLITAFYMLAIAFSVVMLILSVLVFEIFRTQRKILDVLQDIAPGSMDDYDGGVGDVPFDGGDDPESGLFDPYGDRDESEEMSGLVPDREGPQDFGKGSGGGGE